MRIFGKAGRVGLAGIAAAVLVAGTAGFAASAFAQVPYPPFPPPGAAPAAPVAAPAAPSGSGAVPTARFYGSVSGSTGGTITASVGSSPCGQGTVNGSGTYSVDIQSAPGCTTAGGTVTFSVNGKPATPNGTIPDLAGSPVQLNLKLGAAPTPVATRVAPVTPPRPPVVSPPPPRPVATPIARPAVQGPRAQGPAKAQGPWKGPIAGKGPYRAQGPAKAAGRPAYQAPAYGAGGGTPRLPSTGTGGLLDAQSGSVSSWALVAALLAAFGMGASGLMTLRRNR